MLAAVNVQQHAWHRPPWPAAPVRPALTPFRHQTRSLQRLLHPGVAQTDPMLFPQFLVEVTHVQIEIHFLIQPQHLLRRFHRNPVNASLPTSLIK